MDNALAHITVVAVFIVAAVTGIFYVVNDSEKYEKTSPEGITYRINVVNGHDYIWIRTLSATVHDPDCRHPKHKRGANEDGGVPW